MAKIVWSSSAQDDIRRIFDYISIDSEFYAEKMIDKIYDRASVLEMHTKVGKMVKEFKDESIREYLKSPTESYIELKVKTKFLLLECITVPGC